MPTIKPGIFVETVHFAHISINVQSHVSVNSENFPEIINEKMQEILDEYKPERVAVDPEFCCNALTEMGLVGNNLGDVIAAANKLAEWVESHPKLEMVP
jgi:Holliday junction resolvasome RuvABC endonuclease subunit